MRPFAILLLAGLSGCGFAEESRLSGVAKTAQSSMLGMTRDAVIECAGVPDRTAKTTNAEYFVFNDSDGTSGTMSNGLSSMSFGADTCQTNIKLEAGRVTNVRYVANNPGALPGYADSPLYCGKRLQVCVPQK